MSAEICRVLAFSGLIVFFDCLIHCLILCLLFGALGAMFMDMGDVKKEEFMWKFTTATMVVGALSLVFALNFGLFYLMLE